MDAPRLHVDAEGEGPTVALLHGFGGSARNFGSLARALRDRQRVLRWDARGHARSEAPTAPGSYRPEAFVADLGRVLDDGGAREAVVGGLSMGAGIALRFALAHPARVRALVLAAFPAAPHEGGGFARIARQFADAIEVRGLEAAGDEFVWGPSSGLDDAAAQFVRRGFLEHKPHALVLTLRELIAAQPPVAALAPALAALRMPALVIVGAQDRSSRGPSDALAAALPDARLVVVPDAGHVVNLQRPAVFNAAVAGFLRDVG